MLQHENKRLRLNQRSPEDEKLSVLQSLLDDSLQQVNQMRLENRYIHSCLYFILISVILFEDCIGKDLMQNKHN